MARIYLVRGPSSIVEGEPLDAHLCRTLIQRNLEAIFEEARQDYCSILPMSEQVTSDWLHGPVPVLMRLDRDGQWRSQKIQALCCGGSDARTLRVYLTEGNRTPDSAMDPYEDITVASGTTNIWQTAVEISVPRGWWPWPLTRYPSGDEDGFVCIGWIVFQWQSYIGLYPPQFAGFRLIEQVYF